mgnify:CR=1|jgi:hypothetical protein
MSFGTPELDFHRPLTSPQGGFNKLQHYYLVYDGSGKTAKLQDAVIDYHKKLFTDLI